MAKNWPWLALVAGVLLVGGTLLAIRAPGSDSRPGSGAPVAPGGDAKDQALVRVDQAGGVEVTVTFLNPAQPPTDGTLAFEVGMDTHSVSLSQLDLTKLATLKPEPGAAVSRGFTWQAEGDGDHHRSGILRVPNRDAQGNPIFDGRKTKALVLELKDIGVPLRTFRWEGVIQ